VRPILSTRLFAAGPLRAPELALACDRGFCDLELLASPRHLDVLDASSVRRTAAELARAGVRAPWLHLEQPLLNQLTGRGALERLGDAIAAFSVRTVAASTRSWGVRDDATFLDLDELRGQVETAGARLALDLSQVDDRVVRRLPPDIGVCWDLAGAEDPRQGDDLVAGGRLLAVRVARLADGQRAVPDRHEAELLEEVFRLRAPGDLIYDVDDPSGFGAIGELSRVIDELHEFHAGAKRPHPEDGGGLFWASLAPG
jgi:hypothetical protein